MERSEERFEQAAQWLVKLEALGEVPVSPEELQAWDEWAADDENRAAFDELAAVRHQLKALGSQGASATLARRRRVYWKPVGLIAATVMAVIVGLIALYDEQFVRQTESVVPLVGAHATRTGEHRTIDLPDGSVVVLGGASALSVRYTAHQRNVMLDRGEAIFRVAHRTEQPFRVLAGSGTITALGTKFNVRHNADRVVVTVAEGAVEVAPEFSSDVARWLPVRIERDQAMSYGTGGHASAVERADAEIATAWSRGTLVYRRRPLSDVIEDVSRYWPYEVELGPGVADLTYTGTVGERNVAGWIEGLPQIFPVDVEHADGKRIVIQLRKP